jgi:hypothetical protein
MYVLKIANESRNQASPLSVFAPATAEPSLVVSARITKTPSESQNPP